MQQEQSALEEKGSQEWWGRVGGTVTSEQHHGLPVVKQSKQSKSSKDHPPAQQS